MRFVSGELHAKIWRPSQTVPAHFAFRAAAAAAGTAGAVWAGLSDVTLTDADLDAVTLATLQRALSQSLGAPERFVEAFQAASSARALEMLAADPGSFIPAGAVGSWSAVAQRRGRYSVIFGPSGAPVVFDQGDYFSRHTCAPCALVDVAGVACVLVGVDWDRLELWALDSGVFVAGVGDGDPFLGRLLPCPDGRLVAVDGWVWHPCHVLSLVTLPATPADAVLGLVTLRSAPLSWVFDRPMVWVRSNAGLLLAVAGVADGEEEFSCLVGVELFDPASSSPLPVRQLVAVGRDKTAAELGDGLPVTRLDVDALTGTSLAATSEGIELSGPFGRVLFPLERFGL